MRTGEKLSQRKEEEAEDRREGIAFPQRPSVISATSARVVFNY
jgi:hypothetical protein